MNALKTTSVEPGLPTVTTRDKPCETCSPTFKYYVRVLLATVYVLIILLYAFTIVNHLSTVELQKSIGYLASLDFPTFLKAIQLVGHLKEDEQRIMPFNQSQSADDMLLEQMYRLLYPLHFIPAEVVQPNDPDFEID